jgi:hypothetical protein
MLTRAVKLMGCPSRRAQESADSGMKKLRPKTGRQAQECAVHGSPVTATSARCGPTSKCNQNESQYMYQRERMRGIIEEL